MNPCFLTHEARDEAERTWVCSGRMGPRPGVKAIDVSLQERAPRDKPLNFVYSGVPLVHWGLLAALGDEVVRRDLYLGRVINDRAQALKDWVTARARRHMIVRGSEEAHQSTCPGCGRIRYWATGARYLYPPPPIDAAIFESDFLGFVVTEDIYQRIAAQKWRRLTIEPLPILDPPPDGLGALSADWPR